MGGLLEIWEWGVLCYERHVFCLQNLNMKSTDLILDVNQRTFEAALFINDWVYDLNLGEWL